ncbi:MULTISPECIES: type I pantothenate kinase [unclassified Streptococcus]|uniref:type I pantothenate kinase n=1 Tax=unclassified Streptococcus TaxID=2608887 RepID=UPI0010728B6C|nr:MULTISPECIES: type I pantothenate kinase [unclassified Streptococcus]MBF0786380.1 type I pantothenate kinase [Streptococcus sp. 19428wC2_LYSM12]MCQ9212487.1 type I pantothenate kinase [Streptococcus sp. B01]MCQ9213826.1 type I pantothenate kinase [Streptococcus sp. O1]TFV06865.1 type I pantothenate kinase [Streptococcus sp. LYSM12]
MKNELINFEKISRQTWQRLHRNTTVPLTQEELNSIKSFNDTISLQDVLDVYLPLINLIRIYKKASEDLSFSKSLFLQKKIKIQPFIIGISGSVAVGKSTTSRLLQILLTRTFKHAKVEMVTTDGFLYPNAFLKEKNLLARKGFPESYNMELLLDFLNTIENGHDFQIPLYSHEVYDIIPNQYQTISAPDILIVEGINVFQNPQNQHLYVSDSFDLAIYVDAEVENIESWYLERFKKLLKLAENNPSNYYHRFLDMSEEEISAFAHSVWETINLINLKDYIEPTRHRADIILHKAKNHEIDEIYLKK